MYVAIPDRESIQICIMSELGLCTMKTALYPSRYDRMVSVRFIPRE